MSKNWIIFTFISFFFAGVIISIWVVEENRVKAKISTETLAETSIGRDSLNSNRINVGNKSRIVKEIKEGETFWIDPNHLYADAENKLWVKTHATVYDFHTEGGFASVKIQLKNGKFNISLNDCDKDYKWESNDINPLSDYFKITRITDER